ncbi:GntR family transcriptional regulator / MocR family aminotransferase [Rhizobiales bacterium GAS191]|nr:GntR family transcriptional regulator / MocR family aminotransferase [Rhizobiales bacterium GAS191]
MDPIFPIELELPPPGSRRRLQALHGQLRAAILGGRLKPGLRLPASRSLADALGVARNTVVAAYDLLLAEGYIAARQGAGVFVGTVAPRTPRLTRDIGDDERLAPLWRQAGPIANPTKASDFRYDFRLGVPDTTRFPFDVWQRLLLRATRRLASAPPAYAEPEGRLDLRTAIAGHISFSRGVACGPRDVVVTAGAQQGFDILARILVSPGRTKVAVEDPGYPPLRAAFAASGAQIVPAPVDAEGMVVDDLPADIRIIVVTPSHQFPLGVAMSPRRRMSLLDFAQRHRAVVIEDDYDGEFRFDGRPLDALQTLDGIGSVFYFGTFSKCMFPGLRIGFVVTPPWARAAVVAAKQVTDWHSPVLAQAALAAFISDGHLARHIRAMQKLYAQRRKALIDALARHCGRALTGLPNAAGLHMAALWAGSGLPDRIEDAAAEAGLAVESLDRYALVSRRWRGIALAFGAIRTDDIDPAIRLLARAIQPRPSRSPSSRKPA